jgi:hypothetical protein
MVAGDLHALLEALVSPRERLGEVRRHKISYTPLLLLLGVSWVKVRPTSSFFTPD